MSTCRRNRRHNRSLDRPYAFSRRLRIEPLEGRRLLATLFRVNAGGPEIAASTSWLADTAAAPSIYSNALTNGNSTTSSTAATIDMSDVSLPGGTPMAIFQTERWDKPGGANLLWDFPVSPGQYEVRLYFAETWSGAFSAGVRKFDVIIEGTTLLDGYDVYADVGPLKGVMKSFIVAADSNLDIDFGREIQNPAIKGIEVLSVGQSSPLNASTTTVNFGNVTVGQQASQQITLTNGAQTGGASITIDPAAASLAPGGSPFAYSFSQSTAITLAPGQSTVVTINYSPTAAGASSANLTIPHNGSNSPLGVALSGSGVAAPSAVAYRINAGGPSVAGDPAWEVDTTANASGYSNLDEGGNSAAFLNAAAIDMSDPSLPAGTPMSIFQTARFDMPGSAELSWDFPVTPGQYEVRLYFAETWSGAFATGVRIFDVQIEGATVLDNYDVYADVGGLKGVVKSFTVTSDANLDVDFLRLVQNPSINAIEVRQAGQSTPGTLSASASTIDFGSVQVGQNASQQITLSNSAAAGSSSVIIDPSTASLAPSGSPFSYSFAQATPITLAPGQSTTLTVVYSPTSAGSANATLNIPHSGSNSPVALALSGTATAVQGSTVVYRVNAGGNSIAGDPDWTADTATSPSVYSNAAFGGNSATFLSGASIDLSDPSVQAGTPMSIFQTERFDKPGDPELLWDFPVSAGQYEVRLYFAETWSGAFATGVRVFDVAIEGVTVLNDYDIFADVGGNKGVVKSFTVTADSNLDIDFLHVAQNPAVKGIEILRQGQATATLVASASTVNFGNVVVGQQSSQQVTLTNNGAPGSSSITINPAAASKTPSGAPFTFSFPQSTPIVLAPGASTTVTVVYAPNDTNSHSATLSIPHDAAGSPLQIALSGKGTTSQTPISFSKSLLGGASGLSRPTSLQFGPDGRLYVAQQDGLIRVYSVTRSAANDYDVTAQETITLVQQIPNHNDNGQLNTSVNTRLVTGILVTGTAQNPVLYVNSSDPRIGGGASGVDLNLDTNSSTISRLTKSGSSWTKVDLVRGLPRSEENHHANGMQLDAAANTLYVAMGGNTNMGAPSNNFSYLPEFALSAAILKIDLNAIGSTTYDLPTLDDENRGGVSDNNDPFGGNDGKNQAIIVPGGPVQIYAPGFRNPYDLLIHSSGRMYTVDNGPNAGWGDIPIGEGPNGTATNDPNNGGPTHGDGLHFITGAGYYGGHPNPTRANTANTFNSTNPQSPVPVANPIEGDYLVPGPENGSLVVYPESTNGIAEYGAGYFGGAMQGDLLIASFDNTIKRVKLSADGTQAIISENLFTNVGFRPLDVTSPWVGPLAGTIWVCDVAQGTITVFEPAQSGGGDPDDFDGDGYSNDDEIANGTDPNSPADVPPDFDQDFISNLTDPDDDNDALNDNVDKFAVDADNGASTPVGTMYAWENEGENAGGLLGMGFTGLMTNGTSNYASLYDSSKITAGGAAGVFTIDRATPGTARGAANTQEQAFQFGFNVAGRTEPFVAKTSVLGPFSGSSPVAGQEMGFYVGTGDQDNYVQIVLSGDSGGSIKLMKEVAGAFTTIANQNVNFSNLGFVELSLTVSPGTNLLQASYSIDGGPAVNLGAATSAPAAWLSTVMAVGLIATDPTGSGAMSVTWDYLGVVPAPPSGGAARVQVFSQGSIDNSSTARVDSIRIHNESTEARKIASVTIDLSTALLPDIVFDPNGTAGDVVGIPFTPDSGQAATGLTTHAFGGARDGGFDSLTIEFNDFDPGELFTFRVDIDPTSVKGSTQPGPSDAASISGLEMSGATITVRYADGAVQAGELFALPEGAAFYQVHSEVAVNQPAAAAAPSIDMLNVNEPAIVQNAAQTIRITAPVGAAVRLLQTEVALHLAGVPGGGYDLDLFEGNKVVFVKDETRTVGASGFVDVPVTLQDSLNEGGLNYFAAVIDLPDGTTSLMSNVIKAALNNLPPGSAAPQAALSLSATTGSLPPGVVSGADQAAESDAVDDVFAKLSGVGDSRVSSETNLDAPDRANRYAPPRRQAFDEGVSSELASTPTSVNSPSGDSPAMFETKEPSDGESSNAELEGLDLAFAAL